MIRPILVALALSCLSLGCKKPTCKSALEHGIGLALSDPAAPKELKEKFSAARDKELAAGIATCEENSPPESVLNCMHSATTFAAFRECDRSKGR